MTISVWVICTTAINWSYENSRTVYISLQVKYYLVRAASTQFGNWGTQFSGNGRDDFENLRQAKPLLDLGFLQLRELWERQRWVCNVENVFGCFQNWAASIFDFLNWPSRIHLSRPDVWCLISEALLHLHSCLGHSNLDSRSLFVHSLLRLVPKSLISRPFRLHAARISILWRRRRFGPRILRGRTRRRSIRRRGRMRSELYIQLLVESTK